ncbi:SPRY-domain-containing protein [Wilcoxina mikolae CBS 423.85]|nr:SPRY-domain-containing protein [Wilcoxina mikolae CBS 423.85]
MCVKRPSQKSYDIALQIAVLRLQLNIMCQLLKSGANPDGRDEHGWSANLCCSQSKPNPAIAELLTPGSSQCLQSLPQTDTLVPTSFSPKNKKTNLQLHGDGLEVYFKVDNDVDLEEALIQSNHPLPPLSEFSGASDVGEHTVYFEITVLETGSRSTVGLGLSNGPVPRFDRFPGWDAESWGYHGEDGLKFASSGSGTKYGERYGAGDILGCGVNSERRMFFTKNGQFLGFAFKGVFGQLFPIVGLTYGCRILANFSGPFIYDLQTKVDTAENELTTAMETGDEAGNAEDDVESQGRIEDTNSITDRFADVEEAGEEGEGMGDGYGDGDDGEDYETDSNAAQGSGSD